MARITLWGFSGSTYVRTVRMVLHDKGVTDYDQVPINVLQGEPRTVEHLQRHPFGKVPGVDVDGFRVLETRAICGYLNAVLPGRSLIPTDPMMRAKMDMAAGMTDAYGYSALVGGVAAYHLFPEFVGGQNDAARDEGLATGVTLLTALMHLRGENDWIAGADVSVADYLLAPIMAYAAATPDRDMLLSVRGVEDWWGAVSSLPSFRVTDPF